GLNSPPLIRLLDPMERVDVGPFQRLAAAGRPLDDDSIDHLRGSKAIVEASLVLSAEAAARSDLLSLNLVIPEQRYARTNRAPVAGAARQLKVDPVSTGLYGVLVDQKWPTLVRNNHVEDSPVIEIRERNRPAVMDVVDANRLRDIRESAKAIVHPYSFPLIAR